MIEAEGAGGFEPPDTGIFEWGPLIPGGPHWLTKPVLIVAVSAAIVCAFFWSAFRSPQRVPRGIQNVGELAYLFVRDQIARPTIGREGDAWLPFLVPLFFFIMVMNLMGVVPMLQLPGTSHFAMPLLLALSVYGIYITVSVRRQGLVGYLRNIMFPPGLPRWVYGFYAPLELVHHLLLRAYIFTLLAASYIGGALHPDH